MSEYTYLQPWMVDRIVTIRTKTGEYTGKLAGFNKNQHAETVTVWFFSNDYTWQFGPAEITEIEVHDNARR